MPIYASIILAWKQFGHAAVSSNLDSSFRRDINGLRAVGVLAVTLFHFGVPGFSGGFVGVDFFFVISGFLMTKIVIERQQTNSFSVLAFYCSRLIRILPAMLAMVLFGIVLGYFFLSPPEYSLFSEHSISALASVANYYFYGETGYFAPARDTNWHLHLWSLSVEMQFYLVFPLLLLWAQRARQHTGELVRISALLVASLIASIALTYVDQSAAFYFMPTRVWEFLTGSVVCLAGGFACARTRRFLSTAGIAIIAITVITFGSDMKYPGFAATVPVVGAALIVAVSSNMWILTNPASQFMGSISYSLYLWHWPVWVAARHYGIAPSLAHTTGLIAVAVALGTLSFYGIERPTRRMRLDRGGWRISAALTAAIVVAISLASAISRAKGFPDRAPELVRNVISRFRSDVRAFPRAQDGPCFLSPGVLPGKFGPGCFNPQSPPGSQTIMVWGDSYAANLWFGFARAKDFEKYKLLEATAASCPPLRSPPVTLNTTCAEIAQYTLTMLSTMQPQTVILFSRWQYYAANGTNVAAALKDTISSLVALKHRVIVVGPIPEWTPTLPQRLFQESFLRGGYIPKRLVDPSHHAGIELDDQMAATSTETGAAYVSLFKSLCNSAGCLTYINRRGRDELVVYDHGHLTVIGAAWLATHALASAR